MFWLAMERGASIIVAAEPPSAGKTATLTALLSLTPPETVAYFTRGIGERFSLPPRTDAHPTYILVNEMSEDLPVYTWDAYARRVFELMAEGYSLATTVHADTVDEVLAILEEEIGVPQEHIAKLTFVVPLQLSPEPAGRRSVRRRVRDVAFLQPDGEGGFNRHKVAQWHADGDSFTILEGEEDRLAFARWCGLSTKAMRQEMGKREAFLAGLMKDGTSSIPAVNAAIERFYAEEISPRRSG
jgi:hypothetical protein